MFMAAQKTPEMQAKYAQSGMFPVGTCGAPFGTFLRNIVADYERIIKEAGIKAR
jgi:tripartite-type tricarboxylate transporter receptor subunit TctC